jgi:RNA polymerase sigma-70 factor (ECF subfamily)
MEDDVLIQRFLQGDEGAFRALYRRHTPRIRMIVLRLLGSRREDADDVVQEAWMAACRGLHRYRGDAQFSTWLASIGIRTARRRFDWRVESGELDDALIAPAVSAPSQLIDLERALARLSDGHRAVLVLHDVEGYTHEEISDLLGIAVGTSRSTLTRGRRVLRRLLTGETSHAR